MNVNYEKHNISDKPLSNYYKGLNIKKEIILFKKRIKYRSKSSSSSSNKINKNKLDKLGKAISMF